MKRGELFTVVLAALLIFLTVLLYVVVTIGDGVATDKWSISTNLTTYGSLQNLRNVYIGDDGTVYMVDGRHVNALDKDGLQKWSVEMPELDNPSSGRNYLVLTSITSAGGRIYVYLRDDYGGVKGAKGELVALSHEGEILWTRQYDESTFATVTAVNGTIYLTRSTPVSSIFSMAAYDLNGTGLWAHESVFREPVFDAAGNVYLIHGDRIPVYSDSIQSYSPDGTLRWNRSLSAQGVHAPVSVLIRNDSLYVKTYYGIANLGLDGIVNWKLGSVPTGGNNFYFDSADNVYWLDYSTVKVINPDGTVLREYPMVIPDFRDFRGIDNGVLYTSLPDYQAQNRSLEDLSGITITAHSLKNNTVLWSYHIRPEAARTVTVTSANAHGLIEDSWQIEASNTMNETELYDTYGLPKGVVELRGTTGASVYPCTDRVYVSYWTNNYEFPAVYGKAKCAYAGGIYALDDDGRLLWAKQTDSYIHDLVEKNGTVYYSTGDGKFSATAFGLTAGLIASTLYLLLRFLVVGAVARAKTRLEQNQNRNAILKYIEANPGSMLYDITRGLAMNVGTVRYHLLILSLNHRIKADHGDARDVRYFSSGRQYSPEEKLVIALLKRSQIERLLRTLMERPGLPNMEISAALGLPESAISRYLRELAEHGVVVKRRSDSGKLSYVVDEKYQPIISIYLKCC